MLPEYGEVRQGIDAEIRQVEKLRHQLRAQSRRRWLIVLGLLLLCAFAALLDPMIGLIGAGVALIVLIVAAVQSRNKRALYQHEFKSNVVSAFARRMVEGCTLPNETASYAYTVDYLADSRISDEWIHHSGLFPTDIDEIRGEDLFYGKLGLTDYQFSELQLIHEYETTDSKGNRTKHRVDLFRGIMFIADFHKDFDGLTVLEAQTALTRSWFGRFLRVVSRMTFGFRNQAAMRTIKLESDGFNREFLTRTSDEIKARYLLSSSMMERILDFRRRHRGHLLLSFVDSCMCVGLASRKNYFEAKLREPVDGRHLREIYDDLHFFFSMVEQFDLNTRIWNKV